MPNDWKSIFDFLRSAIALWLFWSLVSFAVLILFFIVMWLFSKV